ncbi:MAG: helix-turn-helix transcriptional regulator [Oscillibacter sp.]|nr:helix-turn-helix transcriptional regulator [Oscillibacter sp.]
MSNYKDSIRALRKANNMTQDELAARLGVKPPAISKWEKGLTYPKMENVLKMSEIFGVSMSVVMGMEPIPETA